MRSRLGERPGAASATAIIPARCAAHVDPAALLASGLIAGRRYSQGGDLPDTGGAAAITDVHVTATTINRLPMQWHASCTHFEGEATMYRSRIRLSAALACALGLTCAAGSPAVAQQSRPIDPTLPRPPETATEPQGFLAEPALVQRAVLFGDRHFGNGEITQGWYLDGWNMIPGAGWVSIGPGYRRWFPEDRVFTDVSASVSWRGYKTMQARVEFPRVARSRLLVGTQVRFQDFPQVSYFGNGSDSLESNRSEYRLRSSNVVGYATFRPARWLAVGGNAGWLKPSIDSRGGLFKRDVPDTSVVFGSDPVFAADAPTFLHSEASITADTRDFAGRPTHGGLYRAAAATFSDRDTGLFSFRRYDAEAAQFVPIADSRVVLALHGWFVGTATDEDRFVPFYLQPSLGGHNSLRGYAEYRFHDRNMLLVNIETRVAMMTHVDAAFFVDAGNVAGRVGDLDLAKRSYGMGLRLHSRRADIRASGCRSEW